MKTTPNDKRRLFLALLGIIVVAFLFEYVIHEKVVRPQDTDIRAHLKLNKNKDLAEKNKTLITSYQEPSIIYDTAVTLPYTGTIPGAAAIPRSPSGLYQASWRFFVPQNATFSLESSQISEYLQIQVINSAGRVLYGQLGNKKIPSPWIQLSPGIYRLTAQNTLPLTHLKVLLIPSKDSLDHIDPSVDLVDFQPQMKKIYLRLDGMAEMNLKRMTELAIHSSTTDIVNFPGGRVSMTMTNSSGTTLAKGKLGLSGRTRHHLVGERFPSIDIKFEGEGSFNGIPAFKLYRDTIKSGVYEVVYLSVMKDMGFPVPRVDLVELFVNGHSHGMYVLMETISSSMFTSQNAQDGNIFGTNTDQLFFDYPYGGQIKLDYFNSVDKSEEKYTTQEFLSGDLLRFIDTHAMAKLIAFSSSYPGYHGLGVDDLRFHQDLVTSRLVPIPRDINPDGLSAISGAKNYLLYSAWSLNEPQYTVWPVKELFSSRYQYRRGDNYFIPNSTKIGLADNHFYVPLFLADTGHLQLTNSYMNYFANNDFILNQIHSRATNVLKYIPEVTRQQPFIQSQINETKTLGNMSPIREQIQTQAVYIKADNQIYQWNMRSTTLLNEQASPSFIAPMALDLSTRQFHQQVALGFALEQKVYNILHKNKIILNPSFVAVSSVPKNALQIDLSDALTIQTDLPLATVSDQELRAQLNIVTYLGQRISNEHSYLLFLIRNSALRASHLRLDFRDEDEKQVPLMSESFTLKDGGAAQSNFEQIRRNYFQAQEPLTLVVFKVALADRARFFRVTSEEADVLLYLPYLMYTPTRSQRALPQLADLPKGIEYKSPNQYAVAAGTTILVEHPVELPKGASLNVESGVKFKINADATIRVDGDLFINGSREKPVIFESASTRPWGGLLVVGQLEKPARANFNHTQFKNYGIFPRVPIGSGSMTGGVTCSHCIAEFANVTIDQEHGEDALNVISSFVEIRDVRVSHTYSDAIDSDFSIVDAKRLTISDSTGDGLDISKSLLIANDIHMLRARDKGLSVGELSNAYVFDSDFNNNRLGIANKDQSLLRLYSSRFSQNEIALVEFIKKPYFGKPKSILATSLNYSENGHNYQWLDSLDGYY